MDKMRSVCKWYGERQEVLDSIQLKKGITGLQEKIYPMKDAYMFFLHQPRLESY